MQIFKFVLGIMMLAPVCFYASAQTGEGQKQGRDEKQKMWVNANFSSKEDAVEFIRMVYKDFTVLSPKRSMESGIYKREVKINGCELTIETESRKQESSWKSDREFVKNIVVIELDKVILDGDDIKPDGPDNAKGLFAGPSFAYSHKIAKYPILDAAPDRDNDKFSDFHYEQHLQWAYQYLIDKCSGR